MSLSISGLKVIRSRGIDNVHTGKQQCGGCGVFAIAEAAP